MKTMNKNIHKAVLLVLSSLFYFSAQAQVKVGDNPTTIDARSVLELETDSQALYLPRLTTTQRDAHTGWKAGMFVYNTVDSCTQIYDGVSWECLSGPSSEPWYNVATNTGADSNTQNIYQMGNVGIGYPVPGEKLTVNGAVSLRSTGGIGNNRRGKIEGVYDSGGSTYGGALTFITTEHDNTNSEKMRITKEGNVGIGTTAPTGNLDVEGRFIVKHDEKVVIKNEISYHTSPPLAAPYTFPGCNSPTRIYEIGELTKGAATSHPGWIKIKIFGSHLGARQWSEEREFIIFVGSSHISSHVTSSYGESFVFLYNNNDTLGNYNNWGYSSGDKIRIGINDPCGTYRTYRVEMEYHIPTTTFTPTTAYTLSNAPSKMPFPGIQVPLHKGANGAVGIRTTNPTYTLQVVGTAGLSTSTSWTNTSDMRLKDGVKPYTRGLTEILKINPIYYSYTEESGLKNDPKYGQNIGISAQELQAIIPEAINVKDHKMKDGSVLKDALELTKADAMWFALINAVKELKAENDALKATLVAKDTALAAKNESLDKRIAMLETLMDQASK